MDPTLLPKTTLLIQKLSRAIFHNFKVRFLNSFPVPTVEAEFLDRSVWNSVCMTQVAGAGWGAGCLGVGVRRERCGQPWATGNVEGLQQRVLWQQKPFINRAWRVAPRVDLCWVWAYKAVLPDTCRSLRVRRKFASWGEWIGHRCCRPWACPGLPVFLARQAVIRGWWRLPVSGDELSAFLGDGSFPRGKKGARL